MDYSYLNQAAAAASFDSSCLQSAAAAGMDPGGVGLANMPCSYGDLTSCSQMSQAAYRYTAAAASMARSYNPSAVNGIGSGLGSSLSGGSVMMGGLHHGGSPVGGQCAVGMGSRAHHQESMHHHHHRTTASMFSSSMSMLLD